MRAIIIVKYYILCIHHYTLRSVKLIDRSFASNAGIEKRNVLPKRRKFSIYAEYVTSFFLSDYSGINRYYLLV